MDSLCGWYTVNALYNAFFHQCNERYVIELSAAICDQVIAATIVGSYIILVFPLQAATTARETLRVCVCCWLYFCACLCYNDNTFFLTS